MQTHTFSRATSYLFVINILLLTEHSRLAFYFAANYWRQVKLVAYSPCFCKTYGFKRIEKCEIFLCSPCKKTFVWTLIDIVFKQITHSSVGLPEIYLQTCSNRFLANRAEFERLIVNTFTCIVWLTSGIHT